MRGHARTKTGGFRSVVALIVLTSWFGTLLVAAPLSPASAATVENPSALSGPEVGKTRTPTFTFSANTAGDPVECVFLAGTSTTAPTDGWGACTSPTTYLPALPDADGDYRIWVRSAGSTNEPDPAADPVASPTATIVVPAYSSGVSAPYRLDRVGPVLTLTSTPPPSPAGSGAVAWVVDSTENPAVEVTCTLTHTPAAGAMQSGPFTGACQTGAPAFPSTSLTQDGRYTLTATATDVAGNTTTSGVLDEFVLDRSGPVLTLTSGPTTPGNDPNPSWTVTASGGEPVTCKLTGTKAGAPIFSFAPCAPYQPGPLADDTYTLTAQATDSNDNTRTAAVATYELDTVNPTISVDPASKTSTTASAGWTVTPGAGGLEPTCVLTVADQGATETFATTTDCGQFVSFTLPREGDYTLTARTVDPAGNTAEAKGRWLFRAAPAVSVTSAKTTGNVPTNTWQVTAPTTATLTCTLQRLLPTPVSTSRNITPCSAGSVTTDLPDGDGTYRFTVSALDSGTGATGEEFAEFVLDTAPLPPFTVTGTGGDTSSTAVRWAWTATGTTASCQLLKAGLAFGDPVTGTGCTSPWTTALTEDGAWSLRVTLYDAAGNETSATSPVVRLDRSAPAAPSLEVSGGKYLSNNRSPVWLITGEPGATFACSWTTDVVPAPSGLPADSACVTGYSRQLPDVSGTYTLTVTQSDAAGNTSLPMRRNYVLDRAAPTVSFTSQPTSPVNTVPTGAAWVTSGESTATSACTLVHTTASGDTTLYADQACGRTIAVTDAGEGSYVLTVVDTDTAGNASAPVSSDPWVIDRSDPGAPSISASTPTSPSQSTSVAWTVTANDTSGRDLLCRLDRASTVAGPYDTTGAFTLCGTPESRSLTTDGAYRLAARARDAAGNLSEVVLSDPYVLDRAAPAPAVFTSAAGTGFVTSASWSWTGEAGASAECALLLNGTAVTGPAGAFHACASPWTESLDKGDGRYTLQVRLKDAALNQNAAVTGPAYDLDTKRPDPPVVTGPSGPSKERVVTWTYTTTETVPPSLLCQLTRTPAGGTAVIVEPLAPCTSLTRTLPDLTADGSYVLSLQLKDAAGNLSDLVPSNPYVLDTTPPAPPVFTAGPSGTANTVSVSWSFTRDAGATAECQLERFGVAVKTWASCDTPHGELLPADGSGDGDYRLLVRLTDAVLNTGAPVASAVYTLDRRPPDAPTVGGPSGTGNVTSGVYSITSAVETGATAECRLTYNAVAGAWASCTLPSTVALSQGDGTYFLEVRLTDRYGNTGLAGPSPAYLLDTKAPSPPVITVPTSPSKSPSPVFTFTSDADVTNSCSLARGTAVVATADPCSRSFTGALAGLADGDYILTVTSRDAATNSTSTASAPYTYDTTAPSAPSVSGPSGPSQNTRPAFSWTAETGSQAECSLSRDTGAPSAFVACSTPYAPLLSADGTWVLTVRVTDVAGNTSDTGASGGYLLDTTAPPTPVVVPPSSPGRDLAPSWGANVEAGAVTECRTTAPGATPGAFAPCSLPVVTPVTVDGTYTFEVRATDAAGNVSPIGSATYQLDTVAPDAPVLVQPTGPGRTRTPSIAFTAPADTTTDCQVTRGAVVVRALAGCTSPHLIDLTDQPDGAYTLAVRATDRAGNVGPAGTAVYVLDTTAPAAPVMTLVTGSPSSDRAPTFGFNHDADAVAVCRLLTPSGATRDLVCTNAVTLDLTNAADGTYALQVSARDAAGNTSPVTSTAYVLDSTAAAAPHVVGPATPGSTRTPTWRISATGPTECRLLRNGTTFKDWAPCGTSYLADLFGQPDALYQLEVRLIGSTVATASRYRLDTAGPAAAVLTAPPSPSTTRNPTWAISSPESAVTAECRVLLFGAEVLQDWTSCPVSTAGSLFSYDLTGRGDGTYSLAVRLTDAAGNVSPTATSDYVLDTSAPSAVGVVAPPSPGNDTTPTWTLSIGSGVKLQCRLSSGQQIIKDFEPCANTYTADLTGLPDATYTLTVHALSAAGTPGPETARGYVLDTTAAGAPGTLTGPTGPSRDRSPTWTFVLAPGSTAVCKVTSDGRTLRDGPCTSPFTLDLSTAPDGSYTLSVRAVDAAGNVGEPAVAGYILRTVAAPAPSWTLVPSGPSSSTSPVWGFSAVRSVQTECRQLFNGAVTEDWVTCTSPLTLVLVGKPDGRYTLQVRTIDTAGNTSSVISSDYVFDRTAPALVTLLEAPESPGRDTTPTWMIGTAESAPTGPALRRAALTGALTTQCKLTTPRGAGAWSPCGGRYTTTTVGDGDYLLELRAIDSSGATGPVTASTYRLDTAAPAVVAFSDQPPAVGNEAVASWSWNDDPLLTVECRVTRPNAGPGSFTACLSPQVVSTDRREGTYLLELRAVDAAGNVSSSTTGSYRYDRTPPPAPQFTTRPFSSGRDALPTWGFSVPEDATATCVASHNGVVVSDGRCPGSFTLDLRGEQPGVWTLSVHYVDSAGNVGPSTVTSYTLLSALGAAPVTGTPIGLGPLAPALPGPRVPNSGPTLVGGDPAGDPVFGTGDVPASAASPLQPVKDLTQQVKTAAGKLPVPLPVPGIPPGVGVPDAIKNVIGSTISKPGLPVALLFIVLLFLLVQNQIDRRDPKLAAAPVLTEPDLAFGPRVIHATGGVRA